MRNLPYGYDMTAFESSGAVDLGDPPPIPGARWDSTGHPRRPLVIWVRTGAAQMRIDDTAVVHLTAGQGIWIPAEGWNHRECITGPGAVVFPLWPDAVVAGDPVTEPTRFDVPDDWQDWLIQHYNLQLTPFSGHGYSQDTIAELLRPPGSRPLPLASSGGGAPAGALAPPPMPCADGARAVAEELLRDPALGLTVEQWATRAFTSARTLRRDFLADTGLTFERWRLRCRMVAAIELLASGHDVGQTTTRLGFATRNGFTRAFKQQFAQTPHEFSRALAARAADPDLARLTATARQAAELVRMLREHDTPAVPELLPPTRTPSHANVTHVLSWMYRGSGYLDIGEQHYERERGVATWIPAGVDHITGLRENSISLPLGEASTSDLALTAPLHVRFSPAWDDYLMFCSITARAGLRPDGYDPRHILELFSEQVAAQRALSVPMPTDRHAHAVAMDYLRHIGTSGTSTAFEVPADVHRAFREQTGMSVSRWRYAARMRIARELLAGGAKASVVARRVGYRHLPNFSTAFSHFHGVSPREYQEREAIPRP